MLSDLALYLPITIDAFHPRN